MQDPYLNSVLEAIASDALDADSPHLITVDELRAAGALDVPASWRKSLGAESEIHGANGTLPLFDGFSSDDSSDDSNDAPSAAEPQRSASR